MTVPIFFLRAPVRQATLDLLALLGPLVRIASGVDFCSYERIRMVSIKFYGKKLTVLFFFFLCSTVISLFFFYIYI